MTATLLAYPYNRETQRTRALYLGSFNVDLDPAQIPLDGSVAAGGSAYGIRLVSGREVDMRPFEICSAGLERIRGWLTSHGSFLPRQREKEAALAFAERERILAEQMLRRDIELRLRAEVERELRHKMDVESRSRPTSWLERAIEAVAEAGREVVREAGRLRESGVELTSVRPAVANGVGQRTELDRLQERANFLRLTCHEAFESSCKEAKLMGQRRTRG